MRVKLFLDTGDPDTLIKIARDPSGLVQGFTTNPSLLRKAGVASYEKFVRDILPHIENRPLSLEVLSDDQDIMLKEARELARWGDQVYVKIPITDTLGDPTVRVLSVLARERIKLNVTAILTLDQVRRAFFALDGASVPTIISVFAGRIADTGRDPVETMDEAKNILSWNPNLQLLWASTRETLNVVQADRIGCDIITVSPDILGKLPRIGQDLQQISLETVAEFFVDAKQSGLKIPLWDDATATGFGET